MLELNIFLKSSDKPNIRTREKHQEIINTNFPILKATLIPQISSSIQQIYNYLPIPIGLYRAVCSLKTQMEVNQ